MLLVVITPTCGMCLKMYSMIGTAVATIPDGIVNGLVRDLPRKPIVKTGGLRAVDALGGGFYPLAPKATICRSDDV